MIKSLGVLMMCLLVSLSSPALAGEGKDNNGEQFIAGMILGMAASELSKDRDNRREPYPYDYSNQYRQYQYRSEQPYLYGYQHRNRYQHYCVTEQHVDFRGNIYYTRKCQ